jgi:hypothetical protein
MSSQIKVHFMHEDPSESDEKVVNFNIRHFRNYRRNKNNGVELDPCGGHTILSEEGTGRMFVAKCHPNDKFNRKTGFREAIRIYMNFLLRCQDPERYSNYTALPVIDSVGKDEFVCVYYETIKYVSFK